jgi:hypothetical protein
MTDADVDVFPALITTDDKDAADKLLYPSTDRLPAAVALMVAGTCASGVVIGGMQLLTLWAELDAKSMNALLSALNSASGWHY